MMMAKTITGMYIHVLYEEKDNFWDYIELMDHEPQKEHRALWYAIASDELQHFSKIKEVIWADMSTRTDIEKALYDKVEKEEEKMKKCLEKHR